MNNLIRGGAGFIGSHLAEHLLRQGEEVPVLDVVSAPHDLMKSKLAKGMVLNIGNDHEVFINELAKMVREQVNPKAEIIGLPYEKVHGNRIRQGPETSSITGLPGPWIRSSMTCANSTNGAGNLKFESYFFPP